MSSRALQSLLNDSTCNRGIGTHNTTRNRTQTTVTNACDSCFVGKQSGGSDNYYPKKPFIEVPRDSCY